MPSNKRMQLTKRESLVGGPALAHLRRAVFIESRFAGDPRCSADLPGKGWTPTGWRRTLIPRMAMRTFNVVVERDPDTGLFVGHVPGWPGAHSQGESLDELQRNLQEVVGMLLEDGEPRLESEFVGVQTIKVA